MRALTADPNALAQTGLPGALAIIAVVLIVGALLLRRYRGGSGDA